MLRKWLAVAMGISFANAFLLAQNTGMTAAQIVNKNVAARGGEKAWHAVQTLTETGKMGAGGDNRQPSAGAIPAVKRPGKQQMKLPQSPRLSAEAQLPFTLDLERGRKMRLELQFAGKTAIQVYDGSNGWKVRPYLNRMEVENFTDEELHKSALQSELDGPLVDYAEKGTKVDLEGTDKVNDRDAYRLKLTMKDGHSVHVWIDAKTFLEAKMEGTPRRLDGLEHPVEIYFSDYREVNGLQIPFVLETKVLPIQTQGKGGVPAGNSAFPVEKIAIEKVDVNPKLDAALFSKPVIQTAALTTPAKTK